MDIIVDISYFPALWTISDYVEFKCRYLKAGCCPKLCPVVIFPCLMEGWMFSIAALSLIFGDFVICSACWHFLAVRPPAQLTFLVLLLFPLSGQLLSRGLQR